MLEVDPSAVDFDLESIIWFFVEMLSSVDSSAHELDPKLFSRFQLEMPRKLVELDPGWFYDSKLKIKYVESWPINSRPWLWINFMILSWNVEENKLTLTQVEFMISIWNVEKDKFIEPWLISWFPVEMLREIKMLDSGR